VATSLRMSDVSCRSEPGLEPNQFILDSLAERIAVFAAIFKDFSSAKSTSPICLNFIFCPRLYCQITLSAKHLLVVFPKCFS